MRLRRPAPPRGVDDGRCGRTDRHLAAGDLNGVARESLHRALDVKHVELKAVSDNRASVCFLAARLCIERGLGKNNFGDLTCHCSRNADSVDDEPENRRLRAQVLVPRKDRLAECTEVAVNAQVSQSLLLGLRIGLCTLALLHHERVKCATVDREARLFGNF